MLTLAVLCLIAIWALWWLTWIVLSLGVGLADAMREMTRHDLATICAVLFVALCVYTATGMKSWAFLAGLFVALPCLILATKRGDTRRVTVKQPQRRINRHV